MNDKSTLILTDPAPTAEGVSGVGLVTVTSGSSASLVFVANYTLIPNQHAACWIEQSAVSGHFFVANSGSNDISEVSRNGNTLSIVKDYSIPVAVTDMAIAKVGSNEFLFAQSAGNQVNNPLFFPLAFSFFFSLLLISFLPVFPSNSLIFFQLLVFSLAGGAGNAQMIQMIDLMNTTTYGGGVAAFVAPPSSSSSATYLSVGFGFIFALVSFSIFFLQLLPPALPFPLSPLASDSFLRLSKDSCSLLELFCKYYTILYTKKNLIKLKQVLKSTLSVMKYETF